jgi:cytochrome b561
MKQVSRYHPVLAVLHWLLAGLLISALFVGWFTLAPMANGDPEKLNVLRAHMAGGMLIAGLTLIRLVVRVLSAKPASSTRRGVDLKQVAHLGSYGLVLLIAGSGFATALLANLPDIVFARSGAPLPASFDFYLTAIVHRYGAWLLAALVIMHVGAVVYRQLVSQEPVLRKMMFGRRTQAIVEPTPVEMQGAETTLS